MNPLSLTEHHHQRHHKLSECELILHAALAHVNAMTHKLQQKRDTQIACVLPNSARQSKPKKQQQKQRKKSSELRVLKKTKKLH
jgi:hypothetical protein